MNPNTDSPRTPRSLCRTRRNDVTTPRTPEQLIQLQKSKTISRSKCKVQTPEPRNLTDSMNSTKSKGTKRRLSTNQNANGKLFLIYNFIFTKLRKNYKWSNVDELSSAPKRRGSSITIIPINRTSELRNTAPGTSKSFETPAVIQSQDCSCYENSSSFDRWCPLQAKNTQVTYTEQRGCRCGSLDHKRTSHRLCPLNAKNNLHHDDDEIFLHIVK